MKRFRAILKDAVTVIGTGLVLFGIYSIYVPAAYIAGGGILLLLMQRTNREQK